MFHIYHDIEIDSTAEKVFEMISTPEGLNSWWTIRSKGNPELGSIYNFYFSENYNWFAQVTALQNNYSIQFKMTKADEDWIDTYLNFLIFNKSETKVLLRFEHTNWKKTNDHYRRTNFSWAIYFNKMKKLLQK